MKAVNRLLQTFNRFAIVKLKLFLHLNKKVMMIARILVLLLLVQLVACSSEEKTDVKQSNSTNSVDWNKVPLDSNIREEIERPMTESYNLSKTIKQNEDVLAIFNISSQTIQKDTMGMKIINLEVNEWLRSNFYLNENDFKVKEMDTLIKHYEDFLKAESEVIGFATNWEIQASADVAYSKNGLMTYELAVYSYTGGAHGNSNISFRNYDIISGKRLGLNDIFNDTIQLQKIMNEQFNSTMSEEIKSEISVDEIPLTNNICFDNDTLEFYFNAYEIGPYSMGPVSLKILNKDLSSILKVKLD
jgi:hypothetical protein